MPKRIKKMQKNETTSRDLVIVNYAEDMEQARDYEALLKDSGISAVIKQQDESSEDGPEIAIMVPEELVEEAHVIIESQDNFDDIYDFNEEDNDDFLDTEDDLFNDNY